LPISNIQTGEQQPAPAVQAQHAPAPVKQLGASPASEVLYATDLRGRRIGCKRLAAIELYDLTCAMAENSSNKAALNQAMIAASVVEIDGMPTPRPTNALQLRAIITRLDFDGYMAVSEALTAGAAATVAPNTDAVGN
jgi:hypothetical protein